MNDLPMPVTQSAPALYQPKRPKPVGAKVRPAATGPLARLSEPIHVSHAEWVSALREALGTGSDHFVHASLRSLMAATVLPGESVPTTNSLSAALAFVQSMAPENETQAALAIQAACFECCLQEPVLKELHSDGRNMSVVRVERLT